VVGVEEPRLLRVMTAADIEEVLAIQEPGAVRALTKVFPQETYPFPREALAERWAREIEDPATDCFAIVDADVVSGFAAIRGDELAHFGTAVQRWGTGLATRAHHAVLARIEDQGFRRAWLTVYADNGRARRFYEKLGWQATGDRSRGPVPPHAEMLRYERDLVVRR
jgi:RimJ/RimL family protein N-acetyltransferase